MFLALRKWAGAFWRHSECGGAKLERYARSSFFSYCTNLPSQYAGLLTLSEMISKNIGEPKSENFLLNSLSEFEQTAFQTQTCMKARTKSRSNVGAAPKSLGRGMPPLSPYKRDVVEICQSYAKRCAWRLVEYRS